MCAEPKKSGRFNPLCGQAWWQLRGRRGLSCVESFSHQARRPEKRLSSKLSKVIFSGRIGSKLTSKNLWLADLINASVLSKSIVTYPFAFVPVHHLSDSYFQNVNDFVHNIVRRIPIAEGLARSVL